MIIKQQYSLSYIIFFIVIILLFYQVSPLNARIINITPEIINLINSAVKGDSIILNPGLYKVNITLNDGVSLSSIDRYNTILEPADNETPVILKYGEGCIENITIINSGKKWYSNGIYVTNSNALIKNNIIKNNNSCGIYASFFKGKISDNIIENNKLDGIKIYNSNAELSNNIIANNKDDGIQSLHSTLTIDSNVIKNNSDNGIEFWFDSKSKIINNNFIKNKYPVKIISGDNNIEFKNNFVNGSPELLFAEKDTKKPEPGVQKIPAADKSKSFIDDPNILKDALYYMMLNTGDFNLEHRQKKSALELPLFTKLFSNTLIVGQTTKNLSDILINNDNISDKILTIFLIDNNTSASQKNAGSNITIKIPDFLPEELEKYLNEIYNLTDLYYEKFNEFKTNISEEGFNFINKEIQNTFSKSSGKSLSLNLKEEQKQKNENYKENKRLRILLEKVDINDLQTLGLEIIKIAEKINKIDFSKIAENKLKQKIIFNKKTKFGNINIFGTNDDYIKNSNCFVSIDIAGNDFYKNSIANSNQEKLVSLYFDFSGNDFYVSDTGFDISSSFYGVSYIFDKEGNDKYLGNNNSIASAYFGISIIDDRNGSDFYEGSIYSIGAGLFGIGLVQDINGNDIYQAGAYCQGFGSVKGYGILIDNAGSDYYLSGNKITDSIRYYAHSITMSQGCGFGIRPYIPGGFGLLIDKRGNDLYKADIYGQGTSYWISMGALIDYSGHDKYISHRYSQGAGIHLGIGCLMDFSGDDEYTTLSVSQGCGHDYSYGLLFDKSGKDFYKNEYISQGAGSANGIGIFIDEKGNDGHFSTNHGLGIGEYLPQREFGSIGIFHDKHGKDMYLEYKDKDIDLKGKYGLFYDK